MKHLDLVKEIYKLVGLCIIILLILAGLYIYTLHCNKDASGILNVINVLIGVIIGGIITQATTQIMIFSKNK